MHPEIELLIRLLVAGALAAVLGWEREYARKPAGLRTHMLVGIAAALYTAIAELSVAEIPAGGDGFRADPIRVIQAVAVGIGFLGSGVIFVAAVLLQQRLASREGRVRSARAPGGPGGMASGGSAAPAAAAFPET